MHARSVLVAIAAAVAPSVFASVGFAGQSPSFTPLGRMPGGAQPFSAAYGISADGSVVVGFSSSTPGYQGFRWTSGTGLVGYPDVVGGPYHTEARDVSADGAAVVGHVTSATGERAVRWFPGQNITFMGDLPGGSTSSRANGVSSDGGTVVGQSSSTTGIQAYRWRSGVLSPLGSLGVGSDGFSFSTAGDCSGDGEIVVGGSSGPNGFEAFRWTSGGGMVGLGDLAGGGFASYAAAVSRDGSTIVGYGQTDAGLEACVWRNGGAPESLIANPLALGGGVEVVSIANAANADGSVIVGEAQGLGAFIWSEAFGMRSIQDMLETELGVDVPSWWNLTSATAVSDDGMTIAGLGWNVLAAGGPGYEAWVVTVPAPGTGVFVVVVVVMGNRKRR